MTALLEVASYLPDERVPIEDLADLLDLTPMQVQVFRRYHRLGEVRRDRDGTLLDLLRRAVANLTLLRGREHQVRYVLFARTFPVVVPYPLNPLHELCRENGLDHANAFTVTHQACASGLLALDIAGRLLAADRDPDALALVLAGEKTFTNETNMVPETSIFGEGASACLVSADGPRDRLLAYAASLRGEFDGEEPEVAASFQREYHRPAGRGDPRRGGPGRAGYRRDQPDPAAQRQLRCVEAGLPLDRVPARQVVLDNVATSGHVFCADAFINYQTAARRSCLHPGEHYVMAAAGAARGATFSAMVFQH